jgi:hypothetical protein
MMIGKKMCLAGRLIFMILPLAGGESFGMAQNFPGRPVQHRPTVYLYCYASTERLYMSNIFPLGGSDVMRARNAFMEFLKAHYSTAAGVSCTPNNTEQLAQEGKERIKTAFLRAQDQNHQTGSVIETAWTYSGSAEPASTSPAPPPPAPAASAPQPAPVAQTQSASPIVSSGSDGRVVTGVYVGHYKCAGQNRDLKLSVRGEPDGMLSAIFSFRPAPNSSFASFRMAGRYNSDKKHVTLEPVRWETAAPPGFVMVGLAGTYTVASHTLNGVINYGSCGAFSATLDKSQSPEF